jgi:hypothetical protein
MSELKPSINGMLEVAKEMGLDHLAEAYHNYMNHYDCFFLIEKFHEQLKSFVEEMVEIGLVLRSDDGELNFADLTITQSLKMKEEYEIRRNAANGEKPDC